MRGRDCRPGDCTKARAAPPPGPPPMLTCSAHLQCSPACALSSHSSLPGCRSSVGSACPGSPGGLRAPGKRSGLSLSFHVSLPQSSHGRVGVRRVCLSQKAGEHSLSTISLGPLVFFHHCYYQSPSAEHLQGMCLVAS